jgi:hypothetical protein
VAPLENEWLANILKRLPKPLVQNHPHFLDDLSTEVHEDHVNSSKKAIG